MAKIIQGNLLESKADYICHQCNCKTKRALGLAKAIFDKYPYANVYNDGTKRYVGSIVIRGDGKKHRYIINMFGQFYPGKKGLGKKNRLAWFKSCLMKIKEINKNKKNSYAFPFGIGCGLAGGNWDEYKKAIDDFSEGVEGEVYIYKFN